jgi:hypothetical protein
MNRNLEKRFDEAVMKKILMIAWCVMMFLFIVGCTPVFIVQKNGDDINGIPFYIKTAKCLHQSVYVVPYYQITFQVLKDDKVNTTETITISSKAYQSKPVEKFLTLMHQSPETTLQAALNAWRSISNLNNDPYERVTVNDTEWPKYLVANSSAPTVLVDYSNQYTLNAKSPFAGTVNADYKLNEDGTLSEASGQIQEQTLSTVLSPIADVFKTAAGLLKAALDGGGAEKTEKITLQAVVEKHFLKVTHSQFTTFQLGCGTDGKEVAGKFDTLIEEVAGNSTKDTKSDDNSIKINGTVTLPKSLGATTTTKDASGSKPSSESKSATSDKQKK